MTGMRREYDSLQKSSLARPASTQPRSAQGEALAAFAAVGAAVVMLIALIPFRGSLPLLAALVSYGTASGIALTQLRRHHPHLRFGSANSVTLVRLGGVAVFAALAAEPALLGGGSGWYALAAALALLSFDGIDGWLARREGLASAFGARFDMEVDALLILALAVIAISLGNAGPWVIGLGLVRYAFVAAGWAWPRLAAPLPPSRRRKTVCVVQVAVLTALLAPVVAPPLSTALAGGAFLALLLSFAVDIRWLLGHSQ